MFPIDVSHARIKGVCKLLWGTARPWYFVTRRARGKKERGGFPDARTVVVVSVSIIAFFALDY